MGMEGVLGSPARQKRQRVTLKGISGMARAWAASAKTAKEEAPSREMLEDLIRDRGEDAALKALESGLESGADVNYKEANRRRSAAHIAAQRGHAKLLSALLESGADANARDKNEVTPLMRAAESRSLDCVKALILAGADPKAVWASGASVLHMAAAGGHVDICSELIRAGAKLGVADSEGKFPEHYAIDGGARGCERLAEALKNLRLTEASFEEAKAIGSALSEPPSDAPAPRPKRSRL